MKNPFELRYDLIALAHDHLEAQFNANVKFAQTLVEAAVSNGQTMADALTKFMPTFPTTEQIMEEAKKFYSFVDGK